MLRSEIQRRWELFVHGEGKVHQPRCKSWTIIQCHTWLNQHPISTPDDVAYLLGVYSQCCADAESAAEEAILERQLLNTASVTQNRGSAWLQKGPYLRLISCLIDSDEIRSAFVRRNTHSRTRLELDGRNSADRPLTVWEMMATMWNDPSFLPETNVVDMHEDFRSKIVLPHDGLLIPATAESCKEKITNMIVNLKRIIDRWERSGQGDGGFEPEDDDDEGETFSPEFGSFHDRSHGALASRAAFLNNRPSYLLYLWHHLEENDLLASAVARIDPSVAGPNGSSGVPSVISGRKKKSDRNDMEVVAKSITVLARGNESAAMIEANMSKWNSLMNVYLQTKIERASIRLKLVDPETMNNMAIYDMLKDQADELHLEMIDLKKEMNECDEYNKRQRTG